MKKLFFILITSLVFASCAESLSDNSTALQGFIDNVLYISNDAIATKNEDGSYDIEGLTENEILRIHISSGQEGGHLLGGSGLNYATFKDAAGNKYFTNPNGDGKVLVTRLNQEINTISGSFEFEAIQAAVDTIVVKNGVFFEVRIVQEIGEVEDPDILPIGSCNIGTFVSLIDGTPIQQGNNLCVQAVIFQEQIVITATDPDDEIQLRIPISVDTGQTSLPEDGFTATYKDLVSGTIENVTVGNLIVISHSTQANLIKGTFSFETSNHTITIGSFNVTYE